MAIDYRLNSKVECLHGSVKDSEMVMRGMNRMTLYVRESSKEGARRINKHT